MSSINRSGFSRREESLGDWFGTSRGKYVLAWERAQLAAAVEDVFGFRALQIGLPQINFLEANRMPFRFSAGLDRGCDLAADPVSLPLASASVDLVVLPHVLEFSADPHRILREVERVLMPEGQIVIAGFNPLSLWGLRRKLARRRDLYPWRGEFIGLARLRDWMKLLGFEVNGGRFGCYAPPFRHRRWLRRFRFMEHAGDRWWPIAGGVYMMRAVKRTVGMRLVTPNWRNGRAAAKSFVPVAHREPHAAVHRGGARVLRLIIGGVKDEDR